MANYFTLTQGMTDSGTNGAVTALQKALVTAGYKVDIDGSFGPQTEAAVVAFQRKFGLVLDGVAGPLTMAALGMTIQTNPNLNTSPTPWMGLMESWINEKEITGSVATAFDKMVFSHTDDTEVTDSGLMASGCAATACAALELSGYTSPHNAAAVSFVNYGISCDMKPGCIVVFLWQSGADAGGHHVSFINTVNGDGTISCLGGNQSSKVCISTFSLTDANTGNRNAIAFRWPVQ